MNQYHDVVNKHEIEKIINANYKNINNNNNRLLSNLSNNSSTSLSIEAGKTTHEVHHIELSMNIPQPILKGMQNKSKNETIDHENIDNYSNKDNNNCNDNDTVTDVPSTSSLENYFVTSSFQKDQLLSTDNNKKFTSDTVFPMSSLSKTSLESTSTVIQPLPIEILNSSEDSRKQYEKQISQTDGVLERAYRAIRKRDLNALESKTAIDLEINGNEVRKRSHFKPFKSFEEKFHNSPLHHVQRDYWPMQSDYSMLSSDTNSNTLNNDNSISTAWLSLKRNSNTSSMLDFTTAANINRPRTRAQQIGQKLPYGTVVRPYTTADTSPVQRRYGKGRNKSLRTSGTKTENDKLYTRQQKLIKKFSIDLWGDPRKKPNAFGMDTFNGQKVLKRKIKARKKQRKQIYGKKSLLPTRNIPTLNSSNYLKNASIISSHGSLADHSMLSSGGGSGLLLTPPNKKQTLLPNRLTKSRGSLLGPMLSNDSLGNKTSKIKRRPNTSGSQIFLKGEPGPESVFNLNMAGLHIPEDPPRKLSSFEKRIKRQKLMQERTNHRIELQTLNNRVKQLEIILLEERMAHQRSCKTRSPIRKKKKKKKIRKSKNEFVKLAPFKRSATSAVTAMASALAAAASAERFDKAARRLEDSMGEYGMDDELATESARAVERAALMAGKAIHSATTAIHIAAKLQNDPDVGKMFDT